MSASPTDRHRARLKRALASKPYGSTLEADLCSVMSSASWNRSLYKGAAAECRAPREEAIALDREAALKSASWDLFQIISFNYHEAEYGSVDAFVEAIKGDSAGGMVAFMNFIRSNPRILQVWDWEGFALGYNRPGQVPYYAGKIADAYARHAANVPALEEGPPTPFGAPTAPPPSAISSKTVIGGGVAGVTTLASLADQASTVSQLTGAAASSGYSIAAMVRAFGPLVLLPSAMSSGVTGRRVRPGAAVSR